jgi:hypothetical protein
MRSAISNARKSERFSRQQSFDRAMAKLVRKTPVPDEIKEWFANEKLAQGHKRSWRSVALHPAILSVAIAVAVIGIVAWMKFDEQMHAFPGAETAKRLLTVASATRPSQFEPVETEAGSLADLFLMKYRLEHYDVPQEFARLHTIGTRVFDDDEAGRVAQIGAAEKRIQLFLFPARRDAKTGQPENFDGWQFVTQEGWTGAVRANQGILFMAAVRGTQRDLAPYLKH